MLKDASPFLLADVSSAKHNGIIIVSHDDYHHYHHTEVRRHRRVCSSPGARRGNLPLPLDGFRIIDCSTVLAGPLAATHLGDFGADVIKVELPQAEPLPMRATRLHEERNKRSITADLRTEEGQDILLRLIRDADALIENFRPGTFEKWNLGPDRLLKENPRLIIHRLSAFGQTGPWSSLGGYDRQAQAISGATYVTGFPDSEPVRSGFATADYMAGIWGAFSIILAAYWRDARGGTGQVSDLALFEPMLRASEGSITEFGLSGSVRERAGNSNPGVVPASNVNGRASRASLGVRTSR